MTVSKFISEKENCCLSFTFSIKSETTKFHSAVVQQRQRNVQKSVLLVQSCCFANKPITFLPFSLPSSLTLLKLSSLYFTSVDVDSDAADRKAPLPSRGPNTSTVWKRIHCMQFLSCTKSTENKQCLKWSLTGG